MSKALVIHIQNDYAKVIDREGGSRPSVFLNKILADFFAENKELPEVSRREVVTRETHRMMHPTLDVELIKKMEGRGSKYKCVAAYVEMAIDYFLGKDADAVDIYQLRPGNELLLNGEVVTVDYQRKGKVALVGSKKKYGRHDLKGVPLPEKALQKEYVFEGYKVDVETGEIWSDTCDCPIKTVRYWHELQNFITDFVK